MKVFIFVTVLLASVAAPFAIVRRANLQLQETSSVLHDQSARLADLAASNELLTKQLATAASTGSEGQERSELLKLRNEIGRLRRAVDEVEKLRSNNSVLQVARSNLAADANAPDPATVQARWEKAQLGFAGYADPMAALQSALWAMSRGDPEKLAGSVTREASKKLTREGWNDRKSDVEEMADSARDITASLGPATAFSITTQKPAGDDVAIIAVYFEGEGHTRRIAMKKVDGEWKLDRMGRAGDNDEDIQNGYSVWP